MGAVPEGVGAGGGKLAPCPKNSMSPSDAIYWGGMRTAKHKPKAISGCPNSQPTIRLTPSERRVLEHLCWTGRTGAWVVARAPCVLLAASGLGTDAIARTLGRAPHWGRKWRTRCALERLSGLADAGPPGRPARFSPRGTA